MCGGSTPHLDCGRLRRPRQGGRAALRCILPALNERENRLRVLSVLRILVQGWSVKHQVLKSPNGCAYTLMM